MKESITLMLMTLENGRGNQRRSRGEPVRGLANGLKLLPSKKGPSALSEMLSLKGRAQKHILSLEKLSSSQAQKIGRAHV